MFPEISRIFAYSALYKRCKPAKSSTYVGGGDCPPLPPLDPPLGMIKQDRRIRIRSIAAALDMSKSCVYDIVHDKLGYHKICARWIPKQLTDAHKESCMG